MGNLFGLPQQKRCSMCKDVLPHYAFGTYKKRLSGGFYAERLEARCRKCKSKAGSERQKRVRHTENYKAIARRSRLKRKQEQIDRWPEENQGAHCVVHWHKCTECGRQKQYRNKTKESDMCDRCLMWKDRREKGFHFVIKEKDVVCPDCGITHTAKAINTLCGDCSKERRKQKRKERNKIRGKSLLTRARKAGVYIEHVNKNVVYKRDKYRCCECGVKVVVTDKYQPNMATVDHIIPLTKGGPHTYSNVQTMCHACNSAKSNNINEPVQLTVFARC